MIALDCSTLPLGARVRRLRHMCRSIAVRAHAQATPVHPPEDTNSPGRLRAEVSILIDWSRDPETGVGGEYHAFIDADLSSDWLYIENQTLFDRVAAIQSVDYDDRVRQAAMDGAKLQFNRDMEVDEMFERFPAMCRQIQRLYYASALVHDIRPEHTTVCGRCHLVDVAEGAEWRVPRLCLRFVAILRHCRAIKAWATRARHRANAPGGTGAEAARRSFQGACR